MPVHLSLHQLGLERGGRWLFRNLSCEVERGRLVALVGASGAGKTSLLGLLAGRLAPSEGHLHYHCQQGRPWGAASYQRQIGVVFQHLALSKNSTVLTNVLSGRLGRYRWWESLLGFSRADRERAYRLLHDFGLGAYPYRRTAEISGGEQQRTAISRALFQEPEVLLADEPVSHLDASLSRKVMERLRREGHESGRTILCVLHDRALVDTFADAILTLDPAAPEGWSFQQ